MEIGVDIEENSRFEGKTLENDSHFLNKIFTSRELDYCFSQGLPAQHLAARYCAKEATVKALTDLGISDILYNDIELLNDENNSPHIKISKHSNIDIKVSLSHSKNQAIAFVVAQKIF